MMTENDEVVRACNAFMVLHGLGVSHSVLNVKIGTFQVTYAPYQKQSVSTWPTYYVLTLQRSGHEASGKVIRTNDLQDDLSQKVGELMEEFYRPALAA